MEARGINPEKAQLLTGQPRPRRSSKTCLVILAAAALSALLMFPLAFSGHAARRHIDVDKVQQCSIDNLKSDLWFLDDAAPIEAEEFIERRDRLAKALAVNEVDAFILEPGYTFQHVNYSTLLDQAADRVQILWQHLSDRLGTLGT